MKSSTVDLRHLPPEAIEGFAVVLFWGALALALLVSAVLLFHWRKYGLSARMFLVGEMVYIIGAVLLIAVALIAMQGF